MKLWKVDDTQWTVREVDGEPYPGKDSEGDVCFDNSHFVDAAAAWQELERQATAAVRLGGREVSRAEFRLSEAIKRSANDAKNYAIAMDNIQRSREALAELTL